MRTAAMLTGRKDNYVHPATPESLLPHIQTVLRSHPLNINLTTKLTVEAKDARVQLQNQQQLSFTQPQIH
jgi:hypothetical protein